MNAASTVDPAEVAKFEAMAAEWWSPNGKFKPLHMLNPCRLDYITSQIASEFDRDLTTSLPFKGLRILDIGCGGGLLSEPMTRLGFAVTGVDASPNNIGTAGAHAAEQDLVIDYRAGTAEGLEAEGARHFDVILNMEVIEHVADPGEFLRCCGRMLAPGGLMIVATLNRTLKALALAKVGAEYVLRWLPAGTHDWNKFLKPSDLRGFLASEPLTTLGPFGVSFNPLTGRWNRSNDSDINYLRTVTRAA